MIHNTEFYRKLYDRLSRFYIQKFCEARKEGHARKYAFALARIKLQDVVINEIIKDFGNSIYYVKVYRNIKQDQGIYEKALVCFKKHKELENETQ